MAGKKLLFLRFSSLGDVALANFTAMKIKEAHPDWHLVWLVDSNYAEIVRAQPWVDEVMEWNRDRDGNAGFVRVLREARERKFDILVDMHNVDRSSIFSLFCGIPVRYADGKRLPFAHNRHSFDGLCDMNERLENCRRYLYAPNEAEVPVTFKNCIEKGPAIAFAIGASKVKKQWPAERWIELCGLVSGAGMRGVLLGHGKYERRKSEEIEAACPDVLNLTGRLSLTELVSVIDGCAAAVSGDTGTLHIARALGKPSVALFGPTLIDRDYMGSLGCVLYADCPELDCKNWECGKDCLETIGAEDVFCALTAILNGEKN